MKTSRLTIKTPEGIVFSQWLAGPVLRFLAWIIDFFCIATALIMIRLALGLLGLLSHGLASALYVLAYFAVSIGYGILLEWSWRGQTIGKRLFRLRVMDVDGMKLQFNQIVTRNLLRFVDSLPALYFVGGMTCWWNRKCQRLGDIAANTIVIRNPSVTAPDIARLQTGKYNSLRQYPHLAARLRQHVSPEEAAVILQALLRRDHFEAAARVELFSELAAHFKAKVEFPDEATDGVADEQYLRNVADVLYRTEPNRHREKAAV